MRTNRIIPIAFFALIATFVITSCEKEFDTPPPRSIAEGMLLDLADIRQILADSGTYKFTEDFNVYATVTADGVSGAFFRNVFIQDSTDALNMRTIAPEGVYEGDYIRINLNGATVNEYNGLLQLDSVSVDEQVVIQATGRFVEPMLVTLDEITPAIQARLIRVENVEFSDSDLGSTYADAVNLQSVNLDIRDCNGNAILLRTSGYADFADVTVPSRNGSMTAIVGQFNNTQGEAIMQLLIRDLDDVEFTELRCDGSTGEYVLFKNFEDQDISSGGWTQQIVVGSDDWFVDDFNGNNFAKISNFNGSDNDASEAWYISPALNLDTLDSPALSFISITNYSGPQLQTLVSTDFGLTNDVTQATWTEIEGITYSQSNWDEIPSGTIDLSPYSSGATYVAYRYTGSDSDGKTWELDNIAVFDN